MAEPGITQTDILKLNKPDKGYFDWDVPLNENWDKLDVLGAGQLPLLSLLEVRHKLSGADLIGWSLQGSELDGDVYTSVWDLVYAAKQRASTQKSKQIREITYYYAQDEVTGMVFVDSENYNKGLSNLGDSLGYICTYVDGVKYIKLPEDRSFNGAILSGDGIPGEFEDESLPNISGEFRGTNAWNGNGPVIQTGALYSKGNLSRVNGSQQAGYNTYSLNLDASRSSSTYQDGAPVKPRTHKTYRYYKVGNTVVNSGQIDMGNVLGTLASLETSKARSISWGMPDYSAGIDVTSEFSDGQWWTATKAGWYVISAGADSYFEIRASDNGKLIVAGAGPTPYILSTGTFVADVGQRLYCSKKSGSYPVAVYYPFKGAN